MTIKPGDKLPACEFTVTTADGPQTRDSHEDAVGMHDTRAGLPCNLRNRPLHGCDDTFATERIERMGLRSRNRQDIHAIDRPGFAL